MSLHHAKERSVMIMKAKRLAQIGSYVAQHGICSYEELMKQFEVSPSTIRRDIDQLLQAGMVQKAHGGILAVRTGTVESGVSEALLPPDASFPPDTLLPPARTAAEAAKKAIAEAASRLVENNDVVFLGSGSTVAYMVPHLKKRLGVTVISNNLLVINAAIRYSLTTMIIGGTLNSDTQSIVGLQSVMQLQSLNVNKAFIGCNGITMNGCITNTSEVEANIKREAMRISGANYLLTEHSKFGKMALYTFADLKDFTATITDQPPAQEFLDTYKRLGQELILARPADA